MGNFFTWIILGGLAGWIAGVLMGHEKKFGCVMNTIIGMLGGVLGGFLFKLIGGAGFTGFNLWSLFVAVIGAVILLGLARTLGRS